LIAELVKLEIYCAPDLSGNAVVHIIQGKLNCPYCGSVQATVRFVDQFHPVDRCFGPFSFAQCDECGSGFTVNPPSRERLAEFYRNYELRRLEWFKKGREYDGRNAQYDFYARTIARAASKEVKSWIDIGAGAGEVANALSRQWPSARGLAVDIPARPNSLDREVSYRQADINARAWTDGFGKFDLLYSIAVVEHVADPYALTKAVLSLAAPGATVVVIGPNFRSMASRLLGRRWPLFLPGEHLTMPSLRGMTLCVQRAAKELAIEDRLLDVAVSPLHIRYSVRYTLSVVGMMSGLLKFIPPKVSFPTPAGALCAIVKLAR
jgi:2-polyprenyl-3-methyl-5-hydroxy-6-metoxy-1,4-benzoquinol methylase